MSIETKKYRELGDFIFLKSTFEEINLEDILTFTTPEHRWLSNMPYVDITYDGITYPSTENFYQAMKYNKKDITKIVYTKEEDHIYLPLMGKSRNTREYISWLKPHEAKKFSRENKMTSLVFEEKKLEIMEYAQKQKYSKEPFKSKLLATGDVLLEEGNWWGDKFWGVDIKTRQGENHLGKIIMKIRDQLKQEEN